MSEILLKSNADLLNKHGFSGIIIDAAACQEAVWFAKGAGLPVFSLLNQEHESLVDAGPWLIKLNNNPDLIRLLLKKDPFGHAVLWFNSELDDKTLVSQLQNRIYAELPSGETTFFRWYDPRILEPYLHYSDSQRLGEFLSPFTELCYAELNPYHQHRFALWAIAENREVRSAYLQSKEPSYDNSCCA